MPLRTTLNVEQLETMPKIESQQDDLYRQAAADYGAALERLASAYEFDPDKRRDLLQEIHFALWRSFQGFERQCSIRTWTYRVAHNTAASHVVRERRSKTQTLVGLEELARVADTSQGERDTGRSHTVKQLMALIHRLKPLDRQVMLAYLEGMDAASTAEITGLSSQNVATKIHRIKHLLARQFREGGHDGQ